MQDLLKVNSKRSIGSIRKDTIQITTQFYQPGSSKEAEFFSLKAKSKFGLLKVVYDSLTSLVTSD